MESRHRGAECGKQVFFPCGTGARHPKCASNLEARRPHNLEPTRALALLVCLDRSTGNEGRSSTSGDRRHPRGWPGLCSKAPAPVPAPATARRVGFLKNTTLERHGDNDAGSEEGGQELEVLTGCVLGARVAVPRRRMSIELLSEERYSRVRGRTREPLTLKRLAGRSTFCSLLGLRVAFGAGSSRWLGRAGAGKVMVGPLLANQRMNISPPALPPPSCVMDEKTFECEGNGPQIRLTMVSISSTRLRQRQGASAGWFLTASPTMYTDAFYRISDR